MALGDEKEELSLEQKAQIIGDKINALMMFSAECLEQVWQIVWDLWEAVQEGMNAGQQQLYALYIVAFLWDWLGQAMDNWPWVETGSYVDGLMSTHEASEQAFGDTIYRPVERMDREIEKAQKAEYLAQFLEVMQIV